MDYGKMVQKCKKEVSNPQMEFHNGQEENGNHLITLYVRVPDAMFV
jgi:hypothetical protein